MVTQPAFWKAATIGLGGIVLPIVPSCYIQDTVAAVFSVADQPRALCFALRRYQETPFEPV
jgi:hypothetical protein